MDVKSRYRGIQSVLLNCGKEGCFFLDLMSIAEEVNNKPSDLINCINVLFETKCIASNFYVKDSLMMLELLTGLKWHRREVRELPPVIKDNEYTVAKWFNKNTGLIHFRRRGFDTLWDSRTVREGKIKEYYIYWFDEKKVA